MKKYDLSIIGNGILALSTAYEFIKNNSKSKIAIIGQKHRSNGATIAAGAMLNCFAEVTNCSLKFNESRSKLEMAIKALYLWEEWIENINSLVNKEDQISINNGTFVILNSKSGILDSENFSSMISALNSYNEYYEEVDPIDIPGLDPIEDSRPLKSIYLPREGCINPFSLINTLEKILISTNQVDFIEDEVIKIDSNKIINYIETNRGYKLSSDHYLIAAGAYSQRIIDLIPELNKRIPRILAGVGYSLVIEQQKNKVTNVIRTPNRAGACGLHVLPYNDTSLYIGASNNVSFEPQSDPSMGLIHFITECAIEQINQEYHRSKILKINTGNRPATLDTYPLIGETSIKGLWIITGTYRDGFHQSPLLAKHMSNLMSNEEGLFENIFPPERSLIKTFTKETSIEEGVLHYMSGAYERGIKLPKASWDKMLRNLIKDRIEELYNKLDTDYGLSPDMLMMFEFEDKLEERISFFRNYLKMI
ncbi:MAG: FAD-binding oxidoreductase [Rickettsiales bacterium]|nr:MAG: FAD-binding oxidoreductase [Rickettsiales bacterium]